MVSTQRLKLAGRMAGMDMSFFAENKLGHRHQRPGLRRHLQTGRRSQIPQRSLAKTCRSNFPFNVGFSMGAWPRHECLSYISAAAAAAAHFSRFALHMHCICCAAAHLPTASSQLPAPLGCWVAWSPRLTYIKLGAPTSSDSHAKTSFLGFEETTEASEAWPGGGGSEETPL